MGLYLGYTGPYKLYIGSKNQNHVHNFVFEQTVDATCTTNGYSLYRCSCNETEMRDISAALDHIRPDPGSSYSNKGDGTHEYTCTRCSNPVIEDHTFGTYIWVASGHYQQCKYCISQMSEVQAHTPVQDADGTGWHCEVCNSAVDAPVGQLETPRISIENNILFIEPVEGAASYDVGIGSSSELYDPANTSYPITEGSVKWFCSTSMLKVDLDAYYYEIKDARTRQLTSAPFIDFITVRACSNEYESSEYSNGIPINLKDFFTDSLTITRYSDYEGYISDTNKLDQLIAHESEGVYVYAEFEDVDAEFLLASLGDLGLKLIELQDSVAMLSFSDDGYIVSNSYKFLPKTTLYFRSLDPVSCPACGHPDPGEEEGEVGYITKSFEDCPGCGTRTVHYQHIWNEDNPACTDTVGCRVKWCSTCGTKYCDVCAEDLVEIQDYCPTCFELIKESIHCPSCDVAKFVWCDHDHDTENHPDQEPEEHVHEYINYAGSDYLVSEASCTEPAKYYESCVSCGERGTEIFEHGDALGHTGGTATCTKQAVCTVCSQSYGEVLGHDPTENPDDCTADYTCSRCGEYCHESEYQEHTGGTATCTKQAVCDRCGTSYGELADHTGGTATCTEQAVCTACGESYGELAPHTETAYSIPATCTEDGATGGTKCSVCDTIIKEPDTKVPAYGHDTDGDSYIEENATCTTDGVICRTCSTCGESYNEIIEATGHAWGEWYEEDDGNGGTCFKRDCAKCEATETRGPDIYV